MVFVGKSSSLSSPPSTKCTHTNRMSCKFIIHYIKTRGLLPEKAHRHIPYIIRKHSLNGLIITAQHESQNKLMGDWCKPIICVVCLTRREPHFLPFIRSNINSTVHETSPLFVWCGTILWHVLERFQPCGPSNYSDPFHGPVGLRIQSNDFTEKVLSHQICEKLLCGFFLHQCSQLLPEEPWGFGQEKKGEKKNRTRRDKKKKKNFYTTVDRKRMDK